MGDGNGNGERVQSALPHVVITVRDPSTFKLDVGGQFPTLDFALNMIDQARRELEAQWRLQRAQIALQQAADQELARNIARTR